MNYPKKYWKSLPPDLNHMLLHTQAALIDEKERPEILSYLPNYQNLQILDLGAGIGRFTKDFATKAKKVVALDINPEFLKENQRINTSFSNIEYKIGDVLEAKLPNHFFHLIFVSGLFMYLSDAEMMRMKAKILKWLKPKGYLFFRESLSPFTHSHPSTYALLRPFTYYQELFDDEFRLINVGSLKSHLALFADPFRCFWLLQKNVVKGAHKWIK